jgi:hypothetical protein
MGRRRPIWTRKKKNKTKNASERMIRRRTTRRTWRFDDAANAAMTCCALGMLLLATAVLARLDPADVARAYSLSAA